MCNGKYVMNYSMKPEYSRFKTYNLRSNFEKCIFYARINFCFSGYYQLLFIR